MGCGDGQPHDPVPGPDSVDSARGKFERPIPRLGAARGHPPDLMSDALDYLEGLEFAWPGNVRHVEQLAAPLALRGAGRPVTREDMARELGRRAAGEPRSSA